MVSATAGAAHAARRFTFARAALVGKLAGVIAPLPPDRAGPVLLFDGECGLCHRVVRLLLRLDRRGVLRFAPLQGPSAQAYLRRHGLPATDFATLVLVPDWSRREQGHHLLRTAGGVAALRAVGGTGKGLAAVLAMFPAGWRDAAYGLVSRWRHRVFRPWPERPAASPDGAERFLP
jgi:predicted DCC family thiol-disulfide oxidoreductase YuxK